MNERGSLGQPEINRAWLRFPESHVRIAVAWALLREGTAG